MFFLTFSVDRESAEMVRRRADTKRFAIGVGLIIASLALGKLVLIPIVLWPGSNSWRIAMLAVYVFSWVLIPIGFYLAGKEGYRLAVSIYKEYQKKTLHKVRDDTAQAARRTVRAVKAPVTGTKRAAKRTTRIVKEKVEAGKENRQRRREERRRRRAENKKTRA